MTPHAVTASHRDDNTQESSPCTIRRGENKDLFNMLKDVIQLGRMGGAPAIWRALHGHIRPSTWAEYGNQAAWHVANYDFSAAQLQANHETQRSHPGYLDVRSITWFLPPFKNPFFGGIMTVLRFADRYKRSENVANYFVVTGADDPSPYRAMIQEAFPGLRGDVVSAVPSMQDVDKTYPDGRLHRDLLDHRLLPVAI